MEKLYLNTIREVTCQGKASNVLTLPETDLWIDTICTDSKQVRALLEKESKKENIPHILFVPLVGERVDAHRFLPDVAEAGATTAFVSSDWLCSAEGKEFQRTHTFPLIEVENTLAALQQLAAWYRRQFSIPIIGITGSVGKTTTKEMVAAALESTLHVHKTAGNQNSQVGLPLTVFGLDKHHEAAVIEMGMNEAGEMSRLAYIANPDHAVVTNIGVAHIGNLGSQENICSEKLHITDYFHEGSSLFLNADDKLLAEAAESHPESVLYGTSESAGFRATDIRIAGDGQEFTLHAPGNQSIPVKLHVLGLHNVQNALAALGIAWKLGIDPAVAATGLEAYRPLAMRGNVIEANGIRIIDDSYNASPDSMKSGLEVLTLLPDCRKRVAVFADILELGEQSEQLHREVGIYLANAEKKGKSIDYLITIGPESSAIESGYLDTCGSPLSNISCHHFDSNESALSFLKSILQKEDAVLVKGSRGMRTDRIVAGLQADT